MDKPIHDLIISATEINNHHGVGILLQRFFPDSSSLITIRSLTVYGGEETFGGGHHELKSANLTVPETEVKLAAILAAYKIRRILCVPYYREDFIHGVLAKKLTGAPMCTYIMDDQNIFSSNVPDYRVEDLLRASNLCFGISSELCAAYHHKYNHPFHLLPPVVEHTEALIPCYWQHDSNTPLKAAMIGNVWTDDRFQQLRTLLRESGLQIDWYGNGASASWLTGTPAEWEADGIHCLGYLPEDDLVASLASYPCVIVPSGSLDQYDDNIAFSRLSLPSRLIFLHTRTDTPVLLLGSEETAAGRFILNLGTGYCSAYRTDELRARLSRMLDANEHRKIRAAIRQWASYFVLPNGGEWLWTSLAKNSPLTANFYAAFQANPGNQTWLKEINPKQSKTVRAVPGRDDTLNDESMKAFAFLRKAHLPLFETQIPLSERLEETELTKLLGVMVGYLAKKKMSRGNHILTLGPTNPFLSNDPGSEIKVWRIRDTDEWTQGGFSAEADHFVSLTGMETYSRDTVEFDAIISSCWLDQVKVPEQLQRLAQFLTQRTRLGGFNLHAVTAVLHPDYFWTTPAHGHLLNHWKLKKWPDLDEMLASADLFVMNEVTYAKYWEPTSSKTYRDFGKPLGLSLFWRKPSVMLSSVVKSASALRN